MTVEQIISKFKQRPYLINMGAGSLSRRFKCSREDVYKARVLIKNSNKDSYIKLKNFPKILILDIETAPIKAAVWRIWNTDVNLNQIESDWYCLTWAAKWLYDVNTLSDRITSEEVLEEDDSRLLKGIWNLINEADIVIAHNGKRFDIPRLNTRFIINSMQPPSSYHVIDTLVEAKKYFAFTSNKLDFINKSLGLNRKVENSGQQLWTDCVNGDEEALLTMETYNKGDVEILEENYLTIRPWIKSHPNIGIYMDIDIPICSSCGSSNLIQNGYYFTHTGKYPKYKCKCGAESRSRKSIFDKNKSKNLLVSVPGR